MVHPLLVLLVRNNCFKIWHTWVVMTTPLNRAHTCDEIFLSLAIHCKNLCELPNMIGSYGWLCATTMWKYMKKINAKCFNMLKSGFESNDGSACLSWHIHFIHNYFFIVNEAHHLGEQVYKNLNFLKIIQK